MVAPVVVTICNALLDVSLSCKEDAIAKHGLTYGQMQLVDCEKQKSIFEDPDLVRIDTQLGGSSMNTIRALADFSVPTMFVGVVGNDKEGETIVSELKHCGVQTLIRSDDGFSTGKVMVLVTPEGERTMATYLGASRHYTKEDIPVEAIKKADYLYICGYQWDTPNQKEAVMYAMEVAKGAGVKICFDVADPFVVKMHKDEFLTVIKDYADIVFSNEEEARELTGLPALDSCKFLGELCTIGVVKIGAKGAYIASGYGITHVPGVPVKCVDTTGAGDTFAAGFLLGQIKGLTVTQSGEIASLLASDVVSRFGVQPSKEAQKKVRENFLI